MKINWIRWSFRISKLLDFLGIPLEVMPCGSLFRIGTAGMKEMEKEKEKHKDKS